MADSYTVYEQESFFTFLKNLQKRLDLYNVLKIIILVTPKHLIHICHVFMNTQLVYSDSEDSQLLIFVPDVVSQESIEKSAEEISKLVQDDGLNCLINNAGINVLAGFEAVTAEMMIENFHTNSVAPLMITKVIFVVGFMCFMY